MVVSLPEHYQETVLTSPFRQFYSYKITPKDFNLESTVTSLEGDERDEFLNFVRKMLRWLPEKRPTAKELIDDPWLNLTRKDWKYLREELC
jgi:serine/threonine protein kinase